MTENKSTPASYAHSELNGAASLRVLIIDDDAYMRYALRLMLTKLGVQQIYEAGNGALGLDIVDDPTSALDLLICDLDMPDSDGMEFMRLAAKRDNVIPLLVLSGQSRAMLDTVKVMAGAYGLNIIGTAPKPPTLSLLREALDKCRNPLTQRAKWAMPNWPAQDIRNAIDEKQFEPFFQPLVNIETGEVGSCEALARWRHPTLGILAAGNFIEAVEQSGHMPDFTWSILQQAAQWHRRWRDAGQLLRVSVNLSMSSLSDTDLPNRLLEMAREAELAPEDLVLEVTESVAMTHIAQCLETMLRLRMKGFGLAIDDFGIGFSSLQQLAQVPYSELKIDRVFVGGAASNPRSRAVLESSVGIAKKLGLASVGEGVEVSDDLECLREVGCESGQGYFFALPMSGEDFQTWHCNRNNSA